MTDDITADELAALFDAPSALSQASTDRVMAERMLCTELVSQRRMEAVDEALAIVLDEDFWSGGCRTLVEVVRAMREDREHVDVGTVADEMRRRDLLGRTYGGLHGLAEVCQSDLRSWDPSAVARIVAAAGAKDRLEAAARKASIAAAKGDTEGARAALADVERIHEGLDYGIDRVADIAHLLGVEPSRGVEVGWPQLDRIYRVEPGLLTVMTGWPGSGKSSVLDNVLVMLAARLGWRFVMFAAESAPTERHTAMLMSIMANKPWEQLTPDELVRWRDWVGEHFTWVRSTEACTVADILRRASKLHGQRPINGLVIDPWNEVEHTRPRDLTETEYISQALTQIRRWARRKAVHVWVLAHPVKEGPGNDKPPRLADISGSAHWRNKADMGLVVHRDQIRGGPTEVHVMKVRFRAQGRIGTCRLAFDAGSGAYSPAVAGAI